MITILSIMAVPLLVYVILQLSGKRQGGLLLTMEERANLVQRFSLRLANIAFISNIGATLTSLATVYVFFIGTSKLFGPFIYIAIASAAVSPLVAAAITRRLKENKDFSIRLQENAPTSAILPSLFWREDRRAHSFIIKWIQIVSLSSIVWLELAVFNKMFAAFMGLDTTNVFWSGVIFFAASLFVINFVLRYGVRGFAFSDIVCFPIIFVCVALFLVLTFLSFSQGDPQLVEGGRIWPEPVFPLINCIVFAVAALFLNSFLIVATEAHWLRVWLFPNKDHETRYSAGILTGMTWLLLALIGLLGAGVSAAIGWEATIEIVAFVEQQYPITTIVFWLAVTAAIFSTADSQAYSLLLLFSFSPDKGDVKSEKMKRMNADILSVFVALLLALVYVGANELSIPFEQIVFFVLPFFLCVAPSLLSTMLGLEPQNGHLVASVVGYLCFGALMVVVPEQGFLWSLFAPLFPAGVCLYVLVVYRVKR